jgi:hypothetical protein
MTWLRFGETLNNAGPESLAVGSVISSKDHGNSKRSVPNLDITGRVTHRVKIEIGRLRTQKFEAGDRNEFF